MKELGKRFRFDNIYQLLHTAMVLGTKQAMQHEEHAQEICSEPELCLGYFDDKSLCLEAVPGIVGTCIIRLDSSSV